MFLTEIRAKNYSRMERKQFEPFTESDGFKLVFRSDTPKEILEVIVKREKSNGFYWCPDHNEWETEGGKICFPDWTPADYESEATWASSGGGPDNYDGPTQEISKDIEVEHFEGDEAAKELKKFMESMGEGESGEGQQQQEMSPEVGDEIEFTEQEAKEKYGTKIGKVDNTFMTGELKEKGFKDIYTNDPFGEKSPGGFTCDKEGNIRKGNKTEGEPVGKLKKQQKENEKQQKNGKNSSPEKKWTLVALNRCPDCLTETLMKQKMPPPAPTSDWDRLQYTESPCGCKELKELLKVEDEWAKNQLEKCPQQKGIWTCTKKKGHSGGHVAGNTWGVPSIRHEEWD